MAVSRVVFRVCNHNDSSALLIMKASGNTVGSICLRIVPVIAYFMQNIGEDEQTTGESYGKPKKIDEGNELILHQVAQGDLEIVAYHNTSDPRKAEVLTLRPAKSLHE